jgi:hypothetical protein
MTTNEIRRTRIKLELLESDNLNWMLLDFINEFKDVIDNPYEYPDSVLRNTFTIIELTKQNLKEKYLKVLLKKDEKQFEIEFNENK